MIDLDPVYFDSVRHILQRYVPECEVRVFGSRADGKSRSCSDLDLALIAREKMPHHAVEALKDAFAESGLPFQVDVLDWHNISESYRILSRPRPRPRLYQTNSGLNCYLWRTMLPPAISMATSPESAWQSYLS